MTHQETKSQTLLNTNTESQALHWPALLPQRATFIATSSKCATDLRTVSLRWAVHREEPTL